MQTHDSRQQFLDMQEHPEKYTDEQLEAMMDSLDREPDVEQAWKEFREKSSPFFLHSSLKKAAAILIPVVLACGLAWAISPLFSTHQESTYEATATTTVLSHREGGEAGVLRFDDVPLDSILTVVAVHYAVAVRYSDDEVRSKKFILTWKSDAPLTDFIDGLNMFDGLRLVLHNDTLIVGKSE